MRLAEPARRAACPSPGAGRVPLSGADRRSARAILQEYAAVRAATIELFRWLPEESLQRAGVADGKLATVRAPGYHIAGHEARHLAIIRERYLTAG
jgi:hypothetical protein